MNHLTDKNDLTEKVETYQKRLSNFIRKRVRSAEDVKDILQEVMYQLARADFLAHPIEQLEAWLYSVTRRKIIDWGRKKKDLSFSDLYPEEEDDDRMELDDILFGETKTPEDKYIQSLVWQELEKALSELPQEQQDVFRMTELEGQSFKQIAQKTNVPENTLISRKRYAVLFLRKRLQLLYDELLDY